MADEAPQPNQHLMAPHNLIAKAGSVQERLALHRAVAAYGHRTTALGGDAGVVVMVELLTAMCATLDLNHDDSRSNMTHSAWIAHLSRILDCLAEIMRTEPDIEFFDAFVRSQQQANKDPTP